MTEDLKLFNQLTEEILKEEIENPVPAPIPPERLNEVLDIELGDEATTDEIFINSLQEIIKATPKTASKYFFNQLYGGRNGRAVLGELLSVMLNNSMYTYKVAGPQVGIDKEIIRTIAKRIGYDLEQCEGTFAAGGSMTNLMGLIMARDYKDPNAREEGITKKLIVYTSKESHYSIPKNVSFTGIGRSNIRYIPIDDKGRMSVVALKNQIEEDVNSGFTPCMVNATAATTVLGAFDPIDDIADLCKQYDIWLHVDGAYGGSAIISDRYNYLVKGAEKADSYTLNPHKMMATPLSCSIIIAKNKEHLYDSFSIEANYLYQSDEDAYNPGKISLQCGRRNDALKLWTLWKSIGTNGIKEMVDHQFSLAEKAREYVANHPDYTLYNHEDSLAVCFNYKDIDPIDLCAQMYKKGEIMVSYGTFKNETFIRLVTVNAGNSHDDLKEFFRAFEEFAEENYTPLDL